MDIVTLVEIVNLVLDSKVASDSDCVAFSVEEGGLLAEIFLILQPEDKYGTASVEISVWAADPEDASRIDLGSMSEVMRKDYEEAFDEDLVDWTVVRFRSCDSILHGVHLYARIEITEEDLVQVEDDPSESHFARSLFRVLDDFNKVAQAILGIVSGQITDTQHLRTLVEEVEPPAHVM